jgi:hypothetical protein
MALKDLKASMPPQHHANLDTALATVPTGQQGTVIGILQAIIAYLTKLGTTINWGQLLALIPLISAAITSPSTGIGPLILAILALFTPTPVPVPPIPVPTP